MEAPRGTRSMSADIELDNAEVEIPATLLKFEDALAAYVREPLALPRWFPRTTWADEPSWTEEDIARMSSMYMPETPFGDDKPDMLLYELGNLEVLDESFPARLADFVSGEEHLLLAECSGAGKTRLVFETLCHHWGLYFTCWSDAFVSPYGSDDIRQAINHISGLEINRMLWPLNPRSRILRDQLHENQTKIRTLMAGVLRARLLVFHLFYKHVTACNLPPAEARKKWLFLQLRPYSVFGRVDIFERLRYEAEDLTYEMLSRDICLLQRTSAAVLEFIALDEAQVAGRSCQNAFTSPDLRSHRPLPSGNCVFSKSCHCLVWGKLSAAWVLWSVDCGAERPRPVGISPTGPLMHRIGPRRYSREPVPDLRVHRRRESGAVAWDASARPVNERARNCVRLPVDLHSSSDSDESRGT